MSICRCTLCTNRVWNGKAKPAHYLIRTVDFDDPKDRWEEWNLESWELVTNPALTRAIGFLNIY